MTDEIDFQEDPAEPYPFAAAMAACAARVNDPTDHIAHGVDVHARVIAAQFIAQFRPEELPLIIRTMIFATASIGGLEHELEAGPNAATPQAHGFVRFHLNVLVTAAWRVDQYLEHLDPAVKR